MMLISGAIISCDGNVLQSLSQDHNIIVLGIKLAAATIFLSQRNNRQDKTKRNGNTVFVLLDLLSDNSKL